MKKALGLLSAIVFFSVAAQVSAHATVKPSTAPIGSFQTFILGVPTEKEMATNNVRLVLPEGLEYVSVNVKPDWRADIVKNAEGRVTEISWFGNFIPTGYRDEFIFSAQVPSEETKLSWKVYQRYVDGSVVAWELDPSAEQPKNAQGQPDFSKQGPASQTEVFNDLVAEEERMAASNAVARKQNFAIAISVIALVITFIPFLNKQKNS